MVRRMRKVIAAIGLSALLLAGCTSMDENAEQIVTKDNKRAYPSGYDILSVTKLDDNVSVIEIKHKNTGERFTIVESGVYGGVATSITRMGEVK
ncbi:hypothetical protein JL_64 [Bacillus phage JL]|uniref:Uncharacterized protein n=1 Tax=Bacillus phage JL TaxID=1296655 RepID=S5MAV0_9CAUD|nr:hypothetical protein AVV47_gp064 [Bacillus phage JL]AGR46904.1 hypothetical protein JL_64 [Bacillus phage JL]